MNDKTLLIAGGSVAGVLVLGAAVWAGIGFSGAGSAREERDKVLAQARRLASSNPYPSSENAEVAGENRKKGEEWERELALAVASDDLQGGAEDMSPGDFNRMRERMLSELSKAAPAADDGSRVVQEGFSFGFGRYSDGTPAEEADVPRLVHQLKLVDALVRQLYGAGIVRIEGVGREVFEGGAEPSAADDFSALGSVAASSGGGGGGGSRRRGSRRSRSSESSGSSESIGQSGAAMAVDIALAPAPAPDSAVEVSRSRFAFVFLARTQGVLAALDAISAMKPYATVSSLSIEKAGEDVVFPSEESDGGASSDRDSGAKPAAAAGLRERPAPRSSRLVSGQLREPPVRVRMFVDVYSAPPAPPAEEDEEKEGEED